MARGASSWTTSSTAWYRSKSSDSVSSLPASIFEKSRMSLMMDSSDSPELLTVSTNGRCCASSAVSEQQLGQPQHAVHRRADLVAHVGEELGLRAARVFGGLLGEAQLRARAGAAAARPSRAA